MAITNQELSAAILTLQQSHQAMQTQVSTMNSENPLQAQGIRANSSGIENIRGELLSLENKTNNTVEPALLKLSETIKTLQNTLGRLAPVSTQVDQLQSNWKNMSEDMQARVVPIASAQDHTPRA